MTGKMKFSILIITLCLILILCEIFSYFGVLPSKNADINKQIRHIKSSFKVLILGDSFSMYFYPYFKEYYADKNIECLLLAKGGAGPCDHLLKLKKFGIKLKPDVIFLLYNVCTDLTDTQYRYLHYREGKLKALLKKILFKSYFINFLNEIRYSIFLNIRKKSIDKFITQNKIDVTDDINPFTIEMARDHPDYLNDNLLIETQESKDAWKMNENVIMEINDIAKKINADLVLPIIPGTLQVNTSHYSFFKKYNFNISDKYLYSNRPQQLLVDFCKSNKIEYIDLLPELKKLKDLEFYALNDDHFNKKGYTFVFNIIKQKIEQLKLF